MTTLFDLTYEVAVELGIVLEGAATGGSTTTIVDTNDRFEPVNYWDYGTAWILYDAAGAGAVPQGEYGIISSWDKATQTITLRAALSADVAAGDRYALGKPKYPLSWLIIGVNQAIRRLPVVPYVDTSTITTAGNQTEYDLPLAANLDLRAVHIATTQEANNYLWRPVHNAGVQRSDTGTADKLVFQSQPAYPYKVKVEYMATHPALVLYNDKLADEVNKQRIVYRAAEAVLQLWRRRTGVTEDWMLDDIKMFSDQADQMDNTWPIKKIPRIGRLTIVSDRRINYPGDRTPR